MKVFNLAEELEKERKKNKELKNIIDKAIEYIEQCEWEDYDDDTPAEEKLYSINVLKLLNILKGSDK